MPDARLWGINHLSFYPPAVRVIALVLIGMCFLPGVARAAYDRLLRLAHGLGHGGQKVETGITFVTIFSVVLFLGLRASTNLLGDGQLITTNFQLTARGEERVVTGSMGAVLRGERIAPGTTMLYYAVEQLFTQVLKRAPVFGIRTLVSLLGAVFLLVFLGLMRRAQLPDEVRLWLTVLTLFSGFMQLYFGYVENYAPSILLLFLYVGYAMTVLRGRGKLWVPAVMLAVTIFMHVQAILFLPSLVFLVLHRFWGRNAWYKNGTVAAALVALTVLGALSAALFTRLGNYILPLTETETGYGILTPAHLLDVANELLLLMPVLPVVLVMAWNARAARVRSGPDPVQAGAKGSGKNAALFSLGTDGLFFGVILAACMVYLLSFKSGIGTARDWDLFSLTAVGLIPLSAVVFERFSRVYADRSQPAVVVVPVLITTIVMGTAWFGVNASSARSVQRAEKILAYDRTHEAYARENLAIYYHSAGRVDRAVENMKAATAVSNDPRQFVLLAMYLEESGNVGAALQPLRNALKIHPDFEIARRNLISFLEKEGKIEELNAVSFEGTKLHPGESIYWFYLGDTSIKLGKTEEGLAALKRCAPAALTPSRRARLQELLDKYGKSGQ